jgi:ubiquinone/menaquinone biosynthesis C-methylase UbiE
MGFYSHYILPRFIDVAMKTKDTERLRGVWVPHARGEVLEIGMGSGHNLPFYSREVRRVVGVDPSLELQSMARGRVDPGRLAVEFLAQSAEQPLPVPAASFDTVVTTWVLCTITDVERALQEARRVLKPDGRLIFIEHGRAPDPKVVAWQDRLSPYWPRFTGGCRLNRKIDELISGAGFHVTELQTCYLPGPRPMTYTYQGFAQPA